MKLTQDFWSQGKYEECTIDDPKLSIIMEALGALDGISRTMISLTYKEDCFLLVAGPCCGGYLVNGTLNNKDFFSPKNANAEPIRVSCFIGGQDGVYRAEQFVPKQIAEMAATYFLTIRICHLT
jgi:hypothetical protein